mgnify:CR=1 FL=1
MLFLLKYENLKFENSKNFILEKIFKIIKLNVLESVDLDISFSQIDKIPFLFIYREMSGQLLKLT